MEQITANNSLHATKHISIIRNAIQMVFAVPTSKPPSMLSEVKVQSKSKKSKFLRILEQHIPTHIHSAIQLEFSVSHSHDIWTETRQSKDTHPYQEY